MHYYSLHKGMNLMFGGILMMSLLGSCAKYEMNEEYGKPKEEPVVDLGLSDQPIYVSANCNTPATKGMGAIGGMKDEDVALWPNTKLRLFAIKRNAGDLYSKEYERPAIAMGGEITDFKGQEAYAPEGQTTGEIMFVGDPIYYPRRDNYNIMGYHADDAVIGEPEVEEDLDHNAIALRIPISIDGTQDIMTAFAPIGGDNYYSAASARDGVIPELVFEHQMSQFCFYAVSGDLSAKTYTDADGKRRGVYIEKIVIKKVIETGIMKVTKDAITWDYPTEPTYIDVPVPQEDLQGPDKKNPDDKSDESKVGLSMVLPSEVPYYQVEVKLRQFYDVKGQPVPEEKQSFSAKTIVSLSESDTSFKRGSRYNIKIKVYSVREIEIYATLAPWNDGGDIDVSIGDDDDYFFEEFPDDDDDDNDDQGGGDDGGDTGGDQGGDTGGDQGGEDSKIPIDDSEENADPDGDVL